MLLYIKNLNRYFPSTNPSTIPWSPRYINLPPCHAREAVVITIPQASPTGISIPDASNLTHNDIQFTLRRTDPTGKPTSVYKIIINHLQEIKLETGSMGGRPR